MRRIRSIAFCFLFLAGCSTVPHYDVSHCPDCKRVPASQEPSEVTPQRVCGFMNSVMP
jgi:phage FluMu protein Com